MKGKCSICGEDSRLGQRYCLTHHRSYMALSRAGLKKITVKLRSAFKKEKRNAS